MRCVQVTSGPATDGELVRVIEPLASYICATEKPRAALLSALGALFHEVEQTHLAARTLIANFAESH